MTTKFIKDTSRKTKTTFTLDHPSPNFLHPQWPEIPATTSADILTKLLALLTDLETLQSDKKHILVGPNPVTAHLEHLVSLSIPSNLPSNLRKAKSKSKRPSSAPKKPLAVFVTRSDQPSALHAHLPFLCSLSSTLLIPLPKTSERKLLNILKPDSGKVYMIAVFDDTPGTEELREILNAGEGSEAVGKVDAPDALKDDNGWKEAKSIAVQTAIGKPKKRKDDGDAEKDEGAAKNAKKSKRGG